MTDATFVLSVRPAPLARPRSVLVAAIALVAALLALQAGGLVPRLLPRGAAAPAPGAGVVAPEPAAAVAAAATAAASRIGPAAEPGVLEARDPAYRARFDGNGFSYLPAGATAPLRIDLAGVAVGGEQVVLDRGAWTADGSVLERRVSSSLTERVTARDGQVEWDVVLSEALPGSGDLVVRGALGGAAGTPVVKEHLVEVPLPGGASAPVGEVVVKDADGAVLHRGLPAVTGGSIELRVPAAALDGARYPITVDPTVGEKKTLAAAGNRFEPAIASTGGAGGTHLVVWQEFVAGQYDIYGSVITDDGIGSTHPRQLSTGSAGDFRPDVAWNGSTYLVVFESQYVPNPSDVDIKAQRVDRNGTLVDFNFGIITTADGQGQPAITSTSTGFTIAWNDNRNGNWDIYAGRFGPTGAGQDGNGKRLSSDTEPFLDDEFYPDVAWNGTSTMVAWQESSVGENQINTGRLFANGEPELGHNGSFRIGYHHQRPAIASDGSRWLVVFEEKNISTGASDIVGIHLTSDNFHDGAFPISQQPGNESEPGVAYSGDRFLVVLTDRRHTNDPDVRAIRLDRNAAKLETDTFYVEGATNENDFAAVAPGRGSGWAVGYEDGTGPQTAIRWRHVSK